jgi:hypothetical protein
MTAIPKVKREAREKVAKDTAEFLARGGKVTVYQQGETGVKTGGLGFRMPVKGGK